MNNLEFRILVFVFEYNHICIDYRNEILDRFVPKTDTILRGLDKSSLGQSAVISWTGPKYILVREVLVWSVVLKRNKKKLARPVRGSEIRSDHF